MVDLDATILVFSIGTVAAYSGKYSAVVASKMGTHPKYWNCSNTKVFRYMHELNIRTWELK